MKQITSDSPAKEKIAALARQLWEQDGWQAGRDLDYWLKAEQQLSPARQQVNAATASLAAQSNAVPNRPKVAARR